MKNTHIFFVAKALLLFFAQSLLCGDGLGYDFCRKDDGSEGLSSEYYQALKHANEEKFRKQKASLEEMFKDEPTAQDLCLKHTEEALKQAVKGQEYVSMYESNYWFMQYALTRNRIHDNMNADPRYQKSKAIKQLSDERVILIQKAIALKSKEEDKPEKKSQEAEKNEKSKALEVRKKCLNLDAFLSSLKEQDKEKGIAHLIGHDEDEAESAGPIKEWSLREFLRKLDTPSKAKVEKHFPGHRDVDDYHGYDVFSLASMHRMGHKHKVVRSVEEALKIELSDNAATRQAQQKQLNDTFLTVAGTEHLESKEKYSFLSSLLDKGAQVNCESETRNTALVMLANNLGYAPKESHDALYDCMQLLINKGIDVNQQGYMGQTTLHVACGVEQPSLRVVKALVAAKASLAIKDQKGLTAVATRPLLSSWENPEVVRFLEQAQAEQQKTATKGSADGKSKETGLRSKEWQNLTELRRAKTILEKRKTKKLKN